MRYVALLTVLVVVISGCSAKSGGSSGERRSRDVITAEQIAETGAQNAYEVVEQLRRGWLTSRGATSLVDPTPRVPVVFLDNFELGELDSLRGIGVAEIREIRFIDGRDAVTRYGSQYGGGIIQVITI